MEYVFCYATQQIPVDSPDSSLLTQTEIGAMVTLVALKGATHPDGILLLCCQVG